MDFAPPSRVGLVLAIVFTPPFGFITGILAAVAIYAALGDTDLPTWARVGIAALAVPAIPGIGTLLLMTVMRARVTPLEESPEHKQWQREVQEVFNRYRDELKTIWSGQIKRVITGGITVSAGDARITLLAVDLTDAGGTWSFVVHADRWTDPDGALLGVLGTVSDDLGTAYTLFPDGSERRRLALTFRPAPPAAATQLRLVITHLLPLGASVASAGPWEFVVSLQD